MTGGNYRKPAGDAPNAWPSYWEGRWFLADYAGGNNLRHALLMDPDTEFTGGQPIAADSLYGIIPTSLMNNNRMIDLDFGPDGALYVADYGGSNFAIVNAANSVRRFAYIGGADTPGPDPQFVAPANQASTTFSFNIGKSGGVSYKWDFSDGGTATGASVTHTYTSAGNGTKPTAKLTVTYADGATAEKTIDVPVPTTVPSTVTADVAKTLGLHARVGRPLRRVRAGHGQQLRRQRGGERHLDAAGRDAERRRPQHGEPGPPGQHGHAARERTARAGDQRGQPGHGVREHLGESVDAAELVGTRLQRCGDGPVLAADRGERSPEGRAIQQDRDVHALDDHAVSLDAS